MKEEKFADLLREIRACQYCASNLPLGARPILSASRSSRILIIGQAPGIRVHESGIPWDDASGRRLRGWMGINDEAFYDETKIAIVPMGFCYPGTGNSGDLPPRPECATLWHDRLLTLLKSIRLTILLGKHSQQYVLGDKKKRTLTETVAHWKSYCPGILPMPHPSPRNNRWLKKNPWFEAEAVPWLKRRVKQILPQ